MTDDNETWCEKPHVGLREIVRAIPKTERNDQGQRHRCACCAYEAGVQEGRLRTAKLVNETIKAMQMHASAEAFAEAVGRIVNDVRVEALSKLEAIR